MSVKVSGASRKSLPIGIMYNINNGCAVISGFGFFKQIIETFSFRWGLGIFFSLFNNSVHLITSKAGLFNELFKKKKIGLFNLLIIIFFIQNINSILA